MGLASRGSLLEEPTIYTGIVSDAIATFEERDVTLLSAAYLSQPPTKVSQLGDSARFSHSAAPSYQALMERANMRSTLEPHAKDIRS